ncbi:MAG: preprotein translocase subunit SecE [Elusimicrobia bacterium RIFOXYA12_FULL_51_18]|nr:MAG: preprotein translocase subunit SecE [Elusimicrobia bacterium RIFOXYA12_FULL_51_18]OGS31535.1 MAG: preprotein translocase subunit SecE [Elusimicrobia bacterium RIFOXYA2_FULL_53_38]
MEKIAVFFGQVPSFLKEAYQELTKCAWLPRTDVVRSTVAVSVVVILVAIYVSLVDFGLSVVLGSILGGR